MEKGKTIQSSVSVFDHFYELVRYEKREHFFIIALDCKYRVIKIETISIGTLNVSIVHPRDVFRTAIACSAMHIVLVHNHPSGEPIPSSEDINVTKRLVEAGLIVGIEVVDHIIIGDGTYYSFVEKGLMKNL